MYVDTAIIIYCTSLLSKLVQVGLSVRRWFSVNMGRVLSSFLKVLGGCPYKSVVFTFLGPNISFWYIQELESDWEINSWKNYYGGEVCSKDFMGYCDVNLSSKEEWYSSWNDKKRDRNQGIKKFFLGWCSCYNSKKDHVDKFKSIRNGWIKNDIANERSSLIFQITK